MFTVKVRCADGCEHMFSCETLLTIPPQPAPEGNGSNWDKAGIYLDPEPELLNPGEKIEDAIRSAKEIILFGGDQTDAAKARKGGKVWIMNDQGATVGTYDL